MTSCKQGNQYSPMEELQVNQVHGEFTQPIYNEKNTQEMQEEVKQPPNCQDYLEVFGSQLLVTLPFSHYSTLPEVESPKRDYLIEENNEEQENDILKPDSQEIEDRIYSLIDEESTDGEESKTSELEKDIRHLHLNSEEYECCPTYQENFINESPLKKVTGFVFPDGGWVCSYCKNYNFYGRKLCNRCRKVKSFEDYEGKPEHLRKYEKGENTNMIYYKQRPKPTIREGDWTCPECGNLNFSFRSECNRCQLPLNNYNDCSQYLQNPLAYDCYQSYVYPQEYEYQQNQVLPQDYRIQ